MIYLFLGFLANGHLLLNVSRRSHRRTPCSGTSAATHESIPRPHRRKPRLFRNFHRSLLLLLLLLLPLGGIDASVGSAACCGRRNSASIGTDRIELLSVGIRVEMDQRWLLLSIEGRLLLLPALLLLLRWRWNHQRRSTEHGPTTGSTVHVVMPLDATFLAATPPTPAAIVMDAGTNATRLASRVHLADPHDTATVPSPSSHTS